MNKIKKLLQNRMLRSVVLTIVGTTIYCFGIVFVLDKCEFYAGGVSGISQIIANKIVGIPKLQSILVAAFNIPLFIIGWRGVSKRFAILSLLSVVLQVGLIYLFQLAYESGFDPCKDLVFEVEAANGETMIVGRITLAIVGGILCGIGCALPLRGGSSTGGMDIVSQAYAFKSNIPFTAISGTVDAIIIVVGAILGGSISVGIYTIIRLILHVITLDKIHTIYKFQKVSIITDKPDEVSSELIKRHPHGITIYKAQGAYSKTEKYVLESVIFTYELEDYRNIIKKIDSKSFVYYTAIRGIMGNYNRVAIN